MNDALAKLERDYAEKRAELIRQETVFRAINDAIPGIPAEAWTPGWMHTYRADCHLVLTVETLSDAILMVERANPEPRVKKTRGGTAFVALDSLSDAEIDSAELINPYTYDIAGLKEYAETKTLVYTVRAGAYRVEYRIRVANDPDTYRIYRPAEYYRRRLVKPAYTELVNKSGHFPRSVRYWATDGQPNTFTLY